MSLHQFIDDHREELLKRTRAKVAKRSSPQPSQAELEHGVPMFLSQVVKVLDDEEAQNARDGKTNEDALPGANEGIAESALLHGQDLRKFGYTIDQVVHDYGDVCQAVTELALELDSSVTVTEFHTLNRCLDNAIAGAVASWSKEHESDRALYDGALAHKIEGQIDVAMAAFEAVRAGRVGNGGATANSVLSCLQKIKELLTESKAKTVLSARPSVGPP